MIHKGIRPVGEVVEFDDSLRSLRGYRYELLGHGAYRVWSLRMLNSGCGNEVHSGRVLEFNGEELIYCEYCMEYFSKEQFV